MTSTETIESTAADESDESTAVGGLSEEDRLERAFFLEKYFIQTPDRAIGRNARIFTSVCATALVAGLVLMLTNYPGLRAETSGGLLGLGLLVTVAGIYFGAKGYSRLHAYNDAYTAAEPKPSDEYVDTYLAADLEWLRVEAERQVGFGVEVHEELIRSGPYYLIGPALPAYGAFAEDDTHRYSRYEVVFLFVTQYDVVAHTCVYDFIQGQRILVQVREYALRDIISVDTVMLPMGAAVHKQEYSIPNATLAGPPIWRLVEEAVRPVHLFRIGVASGESIQANIANMADAPKLIPCMEPVDAHNLARAIRSVLREHSGGVVEGHSPPVHDLPPMPA